MDFPEQSGAPDQPRSTLGHVRNAQDQQSASWSSLFPKIRETVERHISQSSLPRGSDMDDLVSEVSIRVVKDLGAFDPSEGSSFRAWVRTISKHALIDMQRHAASVGRGGGAEKLLGDVEAGAGTSVGAAPDQERQSVLARVDEMRQGIDEVLAGLDEKYRTVLELRMLGGMSFKEIAPILGYDREVTVRSLYKRARAMLQQRLQRFSG